MRTTITIILGVLLATAVISGAVLLQKNAKYRDIIQVNKMEIKQYQSDMAASARKIDQLQTQTNEQQRQINILRNENQQVGELKKELEAIKLDKRSIIRKSRSQIDLLEESIKTQKLQLATAEEKIEDLITTEESLQTVIYSIQTIMEDKNRELKAMTRSEQNLRSRLASKEAELWALQEKYQRLVDEVTIIGNQIGAKEETLLAFKSQLSMALDEKGMLERQASEIKNTYEQLVAGLQDELENKEAKIQAYEKKLTLTFVDRILFDFAKATITDSGKEKLKKVGDILKKLETGHIRIEGHTDNVPISKRYRSKFPTNWELSAARAAAVVSFFIRESDLNPLTIEAVGHSFYKPLASNSTLEGRSRNRRVEITIVPE